MKLKHAMRYQLHEMVRPTIIYYLVIVAIFVVSVALNLIIQGRFSIASGNVVDGATAVFLFVLGLNMFKPQFKLMLQNGISRRTQVLGFALCALAIAAATSIIDSLIPLLPGRERGDTFFSMFYNFGMNGKWSFQAWVWSFTGYMALLCLGFFITTLFYRLSKGLKIAVAIGVPTLLFLVLPLLEVYIPGFTLLTGLLNVVAWCFGVDLRTFTFEPMRAVASFSVFSVVLLGLSYLLARRARLQ